MCGLESLTCLRKSIPSTTWKSSMVARVRSTLPFQSPMCSSTARARPCTGFSLEWTGLSEHSALWTRKGKDEIANRRGKVPGEGGLSKSSLILLIKKFSREGCPTMAVVCLGWNATPELAGSPLEAQLSEREASKPKPYRISESGIKLGVSGPGSLLVHPWVICLSQLVKEVTCLLN